MEEKIKSKVSIKEVDNHNDKIDLKTLKVMYEKLVYETPKFNTHITNIK